MLEIKTKPVVYVGNELKFIKQMPDKSVDCIFSVPFRHHLTQDSYDSILGSFKEMVVEVNRVLRDDGVGVLILINQAFYKLDIEAQLKFIAVGTTDPYCLYGYDGLSGDTNEVHAVYKVYLFGDKSKIEAICNLGKLSELSVQACDEVYPKMGMGGYHGHIAPDFINTVLKTVTKVGDTVLDPYCYGTDILECAVKLDRDVQGVCSFAEGVHLNQYDSNYEIVYNMDRRKSEGIAATLIHINNLASISSYLVEHNIPFFISTQKYYTREDINDDSSEVVETCFGIEIQKRGWNINVYTGSNEDSAFVSACQLRDEEFIVNQGKDATHTFSDVLDIARRLYEAEDIKNY